MQATIFDVYQRSKKRVDINSFTEWVARPLAAVVVWRLAESRVTPNQLTLASALLCLAAAIYLVLAPVWALPIWVFAVAFEASFVLDCADGQLARWRGVASPAGHLLDFLMDELKATLIYISAAIYLWHLDGRPAWLLMGCAGGLCVASATAMTTFLRRSEVTGAPSTWTPDGDPIHLAPATSLLGQLRLALEWLGRGIIHYPQYIWLLALLGRLDWYLWGYGIACALYVGKCAATMLWRFGRSQAS